MIYLVIFFFVAMQVIATGNELEEISNEVDFNVGAPTLDAANLFGATRIIQVLLSLFITMGEVLKANMYNLSRFTNMVSFC